MKLKTIIASSFFFVAPIFATNIPLPFNTGETSTGSAAVAGSVDQHYTAGNSSTIYVLSSPAASWAMPNGSAAWVSVDDTCGSSLNGVYTEDYSVTFNLAAGFNPASVILNGEFAVDDNMNNIFVNGVSTGISAQNAFGSLHEFTLLRGFKTGLNTIDFNFSNTSGVGGILVEFTSATATPEPTSYALIGLGLAGLGLLRKKLS